MEQDKDRGITDELIHDILLNVKVMKSIGDSSYDNVLKLYIKLICEKILDRTNRRIFPKNLAYLVVDMVVDKYESNLPITNIQWIQSMSETGRSVNFGVDSVTASKLNLLAQQKVNEYEILLGKYRLLYKT